VRLLTIEDESELAGLIAKAFGAAGFAVDTAGSLAAAEETIAVMSYDAVILDLSLGDGDGPALLRSWHHPIHGATAVVVEARSLAGSAYGELAATVAGPPMSFPQP